MKKFQSGSCIGVFGLPGSGKSTILDMLIGSSREIIAKISSGDIARRLSQEAEVKHMADGNLFPDENKLRDEILGLINKRRSSGAELVILDGFPRFAEQCHWLLENQLLGGDGNGCLIKIHCEPKDAIERAVSRSRDSQDSYDSIKKKIDKQMKMIDEMEQEIFRYGLPYFTVANVSLQNAVETFAKYVGLRK